MAVAQITAVTALIGAITGVLWPVIAVGVLVAFRGPAMRALNRVSDDGGTIEVFGVKVNVGKSTEEQQRLIEDVQKQVATLRDAVRLMSEIAPTRGREWTFGLNGTFVPNSPAADQSATYPPRVSDPSAPPPPVTPTVGDTASIPVPRQTRSLAPRLLWVDDHPENNAVLMASLRDRGFVVVEVLSTDAALDRFVPRGFDAVVSDMGRDTADAGVTLTERVRARDGDVPVIIFCSIGAKRIYGPYALRAGATVVTESQSVLMQHLLDLQGGAA